MFDSSKGKMYLSDQRTHFETETFRSLNSFPNGSVFGPMHELREETLHGSKTSKIIAAKDQCIVLLPVIGTIICAGEILSAGTMGLFRISKGTSVEIINPLAEDMVNYILICFENKLQSASKKVFSFDIQKDKNCLVQICATKNFHISIGKFDGRKEISFSLSSPGNRVFAFVLQGAFEVQYRLMEAKDGLALWNINEIDLEALSNEAIILLIELPA